MIVIIDNYDSFTYNLYQYLGEINPNIKVFRNDEITLEELKRLPIEHMVISPGPGFPQDAGIIIDVIRALGKKIPLLGVCLGHQAIAAAFGGKVVHAQELVHGKTSEIKHNQQGIFDGVKNPLKVTRYHSLIVEELTLPQELEITARTSKGEIMAISHKGYPIYGVQFHPESIFTEEGKKLLGNFLKIKAIGGAVSATNCFR